MTTANIVAPSPDRAKRDPGTNVAATLGFVSRTSADLPDGLPGDFPVQPTLQKYFCFRLTQISSLIRAVPSQERGVAHVINVGRDAVDACSAHLTNRADADGEVVWF